MAARNSPQILSQIASRSFVRTSCSIIMTAGACTHSHTLFHLPAEAIIFHGPHHPRHVTQIVWGQSFSERAWLTSLALRR